MRFGTWYKTIMGRRFGYAHELIGRVECPYMRRRVLRLGWFTLRYHVFLSSDEERAMHDHPWWFITFPLDTYDECVPSVCWPDSLVPKTVRRWRFHYRSPSHTHRVLLRKSPSRTLVITGVKSQSWGFHKDGIFYPYAEWFREFGIPPCADEGKPARFKSLYETKAERTMRQLKEEG